MESRAFLLVDERPISLKQAVNYLQTSGRLGDLIGEILRQSIVEQELHERDGADIDPAMVEQAIVDFRLQNQLTESKRFQEWLASNGMDFTSFYNQVSFRFKQEQLKARVAEPKLQEYFIERKIFLDRVVLSRIIVDKQELAEELRSQIEEGASFEQLAREYSLTDDRIVNGMMGPIGRGTLPDELRAAVDSASPGKLLGPLELEGRFGLFRVEQFLSASLEDEQLRELLQNEIFEQWLAQKIQKLSVKLQVD
ncbi:MAG: peptidylprolyl isomerase [Prochloraceae cyanobacterium]|nr:peptidylprolyl isomerase [Prochloraceae cyanobacterium]